MLAMMRRAGFVRKCRFALISIAARYFLTTRHAFTLDVMEAITIDAILNWSARSTMPWRAAIQAKSV